MKLFKTFLIFFVFCTQVNWAQKATHVVQKGETILGLANRYSITAADLIKANPSLKDGLKADVTLVLPANAKKITQPEKKVIIQQISYKVKNGDTMNGLAKTFGTTTAELIKNNPELKNGLKADQTINIFTEKKPIISEAIISTKPIDIPKTYIIKPKDTKYAVATQFGMSVNQLTDLNPEIGDTFEMGTEIRLVKGAKLSTILPIKSIVSTEKLISHEVQSGETLFSISQKYQIEIEDIYKKNPLVKTEGLKLGTLLVIPSPNPVKTVKPDSVYPIKKRVNLLETVNKNTSRNLVLLLPFNINKIENDANKSKSEYLKSDKFLNITLDFYQGALMAIDSANSLGLPIKVKIYDAESSKSNSNVATIINNNNFSDVDAVIGPFGNSFVETAGKLLESKSIPVISPISSEDGNGGKNVFYALPTKEIQRANLIAFLQKKSTNILAIVQSNKSASKDAISKLSTQIKFVSITEKGLVDVANLTSNLKKGTKNYVILEADKTTFILNVINSLNKLKKEYDIQLVVFERNAALDYSEIPTKSLANLKMLFPTALKDNDSLEAQIFANKFKKENKVFPNQFATRGFDVTFDTILRMCQPDGFIKSTETMVSEQIESQFYYNSNNNNIGVYFLNYNPDLTIKQAE